jgi:hypothetical protein
MGLGNLQSTQADALVGGTEYVPGQYAVESAKRIKAPQVRTAPAYFNQATNEMFAGDKTFAATDVRSALETAQAPTTAAPQGEGWVPLPASSYRSYLTSLSERRGVGELLGLGARQTAEGIIGGAGALAEFAGATESGAAVRGFATSMFGQDENEQLRSALIAQNSSLMDRIIDGAWQAVPTVAASLTGAGAVGLGVRAAGAGAMGVQAGATAGGAAVSFPMHVNSFYEQAVRNGFDPNNPEVKTEILGGAITNTALDMFGINAVAGKVLSRAAREAADTAGKQAARGALRNALTGGVRTGFAEAVTEASQTFLESVLFDPTVRGSLTASDWTTLGPYIAQTYGDDILVAAGAGAILGGGLGGAANFRSTGQLTANPEDLNSVANKQAAEKEAPPAPAEAPTEEVLTPDMYGRMSPTRLQIGYDPTVRPSVARAPGQSILVPPVGGEQVIDINRPLTLQQSAIMRGATGGLRPEDRAAGNITVPGGDRNIILEGEVIPPGAAAAAPQAARLRAIGAPAAAAQLPPPGVAAADFTAGPEGVAPTGAAPVTPVAASVTPAARLRVGAPAPTPLLTGQTTDTVMGNQLRAAMAASEAAAAQQAAEQQATAEATRQAQLAEGARAAEIEEAFAQRDAQQRALADNQVRVAEEQVVTARTAWDKFRNKRRLTLVPKAKRTVEQSVEFDMLPPVAQQQWLDAVRKGKATEALYKRLRNAAPAPAPAPAPAAAAPKTPEAVVESRRETYPDGNTAVEYRLGTDGFATVQIAPDGTAHLINIQIGDEGSVQRGKGRGTRAYAEIGERLAAEGVRLQSTQWSKHNTAISPAALRVWEKLTADKLAHQIGTETGKVLDRTTGREEVRAVPIYEFGPAPRKTAPKGDGLKTGAKTASAAAPKAATVRRGAAAQPKPRAEAVPETPGVPALPTVTVESVTRSTKKGTEQAGVPYQTVTLSDGRKVRMRNTGTNFAQVWTFLKTGDTIGEGIKAEAAAARVAELASQGTLPDTVVDTEAEVAATPTETESERELRDTYTRIEDDIADLEQSMMPVNAPMEGEKLDAAVDLMSIRDNPDTPDALRDLAQSVLEKNSKTSGSAALSIAEKAYAARTLASRTGVKQATIQLAQIIDEFNAAPGDFTAEWQTQFRRLVAEVRKTDPNARYGDRSLLSYAKANNDPNFARVDGVRQIVGAPGNFALANWNTIEGVVDLDGKPVTAIAPGRVQLLVRNFLGKLARAPKVTVVRNQADLKAKFPQLYARAVAARPQGDFDTAQAMGYSFGDGQVVVFTDRIATEQQLNFVLAHESMGHYGLRAIMPGPKFDALMEKLYADSPAVKTAADAAMTTNPSLTKAEAVEEYLSDYAAVLETSLVARVWNSIKGFLNKLGIRTGDEMTRYLLDQSRRYVRYGTGVTFDAGSVGQRLHSVETSGDTGRFSLGPKMRDVNLMAALQMDTIGGRPMNFEEGWQDLKRQGVNSLESWDKFKATFLSLANFRSRQNPGLLALEKLLDEARNLSMSIKVDYNEKLATVLNRAIAGEVGGISDVQTARVNEMLYAAQRFAVAQTKKLGDLGNVPLFRMENGRLVANQNEVDRLKALGTRTLPQMRDGFEYEISYEEAGKTVTKTEKFAGIKGLTENSIEWKGYQKIRAAMDDIELRLLRARYEGALQERDLAFRQIAGTVPDGELTADERSALTTLAQTYGDLYTSNVTQDDTGRAVLDTDYQLYANDILRTANAALLGKAEDRFDALRTLLTEPRQFMKGETKDLRRELPAAMQEQAADDLIARLQGFKSRMRIGEDRFVVQNKVKQVILAELASKDADKFTKRTIATGYTPVLREGAYQMRVEAFVGGKIVRLQDSYREQLVYSQFENAAQSMEMVDKVNGLFKGNKFEAMYYDTAAGEYRLGSVELRAVSESALDSVAAPPQLNLNEFIRGLRQFDIALTPDKMEDVIVALTKQNSAARNRLERVFTPGADLDGVMATMRHIESRASTISKTIVRPRLAEIMDRSMSSTMSLWNGDPEQLARLKKRAEDAAKDTTLSREAKVDAQRAYEQYAYMYEQTNPGGGKPRRGNQFYNEAASTVAFLDGNKNVDESDFGAGPMVSRIRAATSMMQLGGSVATGALNVLSVYTNGIPYLSSYNPKTAFGGGFSAGKVVAELHRAAAQVGGPGITSGQMNTAEFYEKVANSPELQKRYKLAAHEARFIAQEILDGAMIPAQSNALVGTARGRVTKGYKQKFLDGWMWTFNVTEQASRRSFGLTAYRLEYARKRAAGMSEADAATAAREFAVQALQFTMGEYSVLNRPPAWRSGIQSFMYMYKVFPTTSVQMFMNMSRGGKIGMLAGLWLLTGLTGLPFAEDLEDVIDTLAQKLKISGWQGARYETAQFIDGIFPGMSAMFLKGVVNQYLPADIAGRTSLGDLLPGTDILLAGADVSRGLSEIAGPAPSMLIGSAQFAADLLAFPFSTTTTAEGVAREAPITMLRALGDAYAYIQSGAVVDRRGYTVSPDMDAGTIITRALGFYPVAAANQYEVIRAAKRMTDYQRDVVTGYRTAWVSAMMRNDRDFARQIEESVDEWNTASDGTALEIKNFVQNSRRALQEARRPASARTLRSAPNAAERDLQNLIDLMIQN